MLLVSCPAPSNAKSKKGSGLLCIEPASRRNAIIMVWVYVNKRHKQEIKHSMIHWPRYTLTRVVQYVDCILYIARRSCDFVLAFDWRAL